MKKIVLTLAIILGLGLTTFAGPNGGGLFQRGVSDEEYYGTGYYSQYRQGEGGLMPALPSHGETENHDAPLGTGIALLAFLSTGYLINKRSKKE